MNNVKLESEHKQLISDFISENWEQFVGHVAGHNGITEEEAEELAEGISEALEAAVMYD